MQRILLLVVATLFLAPAANAGDGVLEINQACAVNTGCFSGDDPGFPVLIATSGSYLLTGNLVVPDVETIGIYVWTNDVRIDLNGFAIIRSECEDGCIVATGAGSGIKPQNQDVRGISVKNGSVIGMGDFGVYVGPQGEVRNVRAGWNGNHGILAAFSSLVADNSAGNNGGAGIFVEAGSTVSGNIAYDNGGNGIYATYGTTVSGNTVRGNTLHGVRLWAPNNKPSWRGGYAGNVIGGNDGGTVAGGVEIGTNLCDGDTTCP